MSERKPVLSICIPTLGREYIVGDTIESIISQRVDPSEYEVCVTDNSGTGGTGQLIRERFPDVPNVRYADAKCEGFMNSIEALRLGRGRLLKLHNDYSMLEPGALEMMVDMAKEHDRDRPALFFSMGALGGSRRPRTHGDYDSFLADVSYWETWSSAFSIWGDDFTALEYEGVRPNHMFPHTTLLHALAGKDSYVVDDRAYARNVVPNTKGGYNIPDNFVRIYLTMVRGELLARGHITSQTYSKLERDIIRFCARWRVWAVTDPARYTFSFADDEDIVRRICGESGLRQYRADMTMIEIKSHVRRRLKAAVRILDRIRHH